MGFPAVHLGAVHLEAVHLEAAHLEVALPVVCRPAAFRQAVSLPVVSLPAVCHWAARPAAGPEIRKACRKKVVPRRVGRRWAARPSLIQTAVARR